MCTPHPSTRRGSVAAPALLLILALAGAGFAAGAGFVAEAGPTAKAGPMGEAGPVREAGPMATAGPMAASRPTPAPPDARPSPAPDSVRLLETLGLLSSDSLEGRRVGSEGGRRARGFLVRAFDEAGLRRFTGSGAPSGSGPGGAGPDHGTDGRVDPFSFERRGDTLQAANVLGWVEGTTDPASYIVVTAHYDHVGVRNGQVFNGADDNASGAAALVEIAHALRETPPRHSIILAALDGEEAGLQGARRFVAAPPVPLDRVILNVNLDMVARADDGILWAAGAHHYPFLAPLLDEAATEAALTLRRGHDRPGAPEGADWTGQSDHAAFHRAGIPFVYFGVEDHADYHRPTDDFDRVDPATYLRSVRTILRTLRLLDARLGAEVGVVR